MKCGNKPALLDHVADGTAQPDQIGLRGGVASTSTSPAEGRIIPLISRSAVVLPEPLRPSSTSVSPAATLSVRLSSIVLPPIRYVGAAELDRGHHAVNSVSAKPQL